MKVALASSMAYRPAILILDEPFSGLDAVAREDLVEGILDPTQQEGWTVVISSHDLVGIEPVIDRIGMLHGGRGILEGPIDEVMQRHRQVEALYDEEVKVPAEKPESWLGWKVSGRIARFVETTFETEGELRAALPGARAVEVAPVGLRDLFVALCRHHDRLEEET